MAEKPAKKKGTLHYALLIIKILKGLPLSLVETILRFLPGPIGAYLRYNFYKRRLKYLGKKVLIDEGVYIINPENISIDDNSWIDKNVILGSGDPSRGFVERKYWLKENKAYKGKIGELKIGKNCHIAPFVLIQAHGGVVIGDCCGVASGARIYSTSHHYRNLHVDDGKLYKFTPRAPVDDQFIIIGAVVMEDNTALGLNSVVLPGVTIGKNSWVGVNSCVTNDIPPNSIATGCPAQVIRERQVREGGGSRDSGNT